MFGLSLGKLGQVGGVPFSPAKLFSSGEQGAWYDPSDFSTLYTDSAGTTPVTAVEQSVGLMLDKSKGLLLGPEIVSNGDFSGGTTGWSLTGTAASQAVSGGVLTVTRGTSATYSSATITTVVGKMYKLSVDVGAFTQSPVLRISTTLGGTENYNVTYTSSGNKTAVFTATATTTYVSLYAPGNSGDTTSWDNISVRELPGNHAYQTTSSSRPTLRARYNLLTYSEQFDNAAWTKRGAATAANTTAVTAPDGTSTADIIQNLGVSGIDDLFQHSSTVALDAAISPSFYIYKITSTGTLRLQSPVSNTRGVWLINLALLSSGWERITATHPAVTISTAFTGSGTANNGLMFVAQSGGPLSFYIWGAQLVPTAVFPSNTYQRIAAATDYDTGSAFPPYLFFDGVDDSLLTNSVDFSAGDKMTVWAGVTKSSDAAAAVLAELSAEVNVNNGAFACYVQTNGRYTWISRGTASASAQSSTATTPVPSTDVFVGIGDISSDVATLRIDGAQAATSSTDQGTGNFGTYPLYIGRRNNATLPLNGNIYSLIIRGAESTAAQISSTESWVAAKTPLGSL